MKSTWIKEEYSMKKKELRLKEKKEEEEKDN